MRWNYAFWILEGFDRIGNVPEDPVGATLHEEEARNLGIWYGGEFDLARYLHASGTIERIFGRPLPVVVFDMDCPGWEEEATRAANPPELIEDFLA